MQVCLIEFSKLRDYLAMWQALHNFKDFFSQSQIKDSLNSPLNGVSVQSRTKEALGTKPNSPLWVAKLLVNGLQVTAFICFVPLCTLSKSLHMFESLCTEKSEVLCWCLPNVLQQLTRTSNYNKIGRNIRVIGRKQIWA